MENLKTHLDLAGGRRCRGRPRRRSCRLPCLPKTAAKVKRWPRWHAWVSYLGPSFSQTEMSNDVSLRRVPALLSVIDHAELIDR